MKKTLRVLAVPVLAFMLFSLFACADRNVAAEDSLFAFTVDSEDYAVTEGMTVKDYMDKLAADGKVSFTVSDGMIAKINGKPNTFNSYWMLYTDDAETSNEDWGTYCYNGKTLGSAMLGAEVLVVRDGCTYAWVYTKF